MRYKETPYTRGTTEFPTVSSKGNARLLDCGGTKGEPLVLLVPSLINRYYILDLTPELSLARYLTLQGMHVFMVDWGEPSTSEYSFNCASYIAEYLTFFAEWIKASDNQHLTVVGYCMGGLLTLALACVRADIVDALACFATPWDFSVADFPRIAIPQQELASIKDYITSDETLSAETIHTLFHLANPYAFQAKLRDFEQMKEGGKQMQDFLAIEHWVQDGVPMTRGVAQDCLVNWAQENSTANLAWRVCGRVVNPIQLRMPVFIAAPKGDKIVPSSCALPLARLCRNVTLAEPPCGHVSMIVGRNRKAALWDPFTNWIKSQVT